MEMHNKASYLFSCIFGYLCIFLSVFVSIEVILRKVFSTSLQGADELGGYVLAIASSISFCVALMGNSHIRIDILHYTFPKRIQAILNWVAKLTIFLLAAILLYSAYQVLTETISYGSTAPTPWATPLKYPQFFWFSGLLLFCLLSGMYFLRATSLLLTGRWDELCILFQPKGSAEEAQEELRDAQQR